MTAIMPCLIFQNIVSNLKSSDIKYIGIVFFEGSILFTVGGLLALMIFYVCKSPKRWFGGLISVGLFPNISDLPIAYLQTLSKTGNLFTVEQGDEGVAYVCIFLASQIFYQFSLGLFRLIQYDFREEINDQEQSLHSEENLDEKSVRSQNDSPEVDAKLEDPADGELILSIDEERSINFANLAPVQIRSPSENQAIGCQNTSSNPSVDGYSTASDLRSTMSSNHNGTIGRVSSRSLDLRRQKSQDITDVINEYSEIDRLRSREVIPPPILPYDNSVEPRMAPPPETSSKLSVKIGAYLKQMLKNFCTPNSLSLIISLIIAMSPPLKALFVHSTFYIPNAPDQKPPLSFVIDTTSYVGAASVPLGLLLLGATIARLKIKKTVPGFWKTVVMITAARLVILPIFGVGFTTGLDKAGWFGDNHLLRFVSVLEFGLPNATALIYFTAFYTDPLLEDHLQMDCLALSLIVQYCVLFISLPILVTFTLKVSLQM